jgi:hypothetical protein
LPSIINNIEGVNITFRLEYTGYSTVQLAVQALHNFRLISDGIANAGQHIGC